LLKSDTGGHRFKYPLTLRHPLPNILPVKKFEEIASYGCAAHPDLPGVGVCVECGVVVCARCTEIVGGRIYCPEHKPAYEEKTARAVQRQRIRPGILIPVLSIIALVALALWFAPNLTTGPLSFYNNSITETELQEIGNALESFRDDNGRYPTDEEGLLALRDEPPGEDGWLGPYLPDGFYADDEVRDASGNPITYERTDDGYRLVAAGADGEPDTDDDIALEGPAGTE
jgi:general secretion pathway protein G